MAERSENVITWNVPNVVTIWLMVMLLWAVLGIGSHMFRRKMRGKVAPGVQSDDTGSLA